MNNGQPPREGQNEHRADQRPAKNSAADRQHEAELRDAEMDRMVEPEYAAISGTAIVALILTPFGLLSFMTIYFMVFGVLVPVLMIVPLVSLLVALTAVSNIRKSEGTRVGIKLAVAAAMLSGLIIIGSGVYHVHRLNEQVELQDSLLRAAHSDMQLIFTGQYQPIYARMVLNNPAVGETWSFEEWAEQLNVFLYHSGGNYYGSRIEAVRLRPGTPNLDDPQATPEVEGIVVRRLVFREGSTDLQLHYARHDGQWRLLGLHAAAAAEFGRPDMEPVTRWEDELTGGKPSYRPPIVPRAVPSPDLPPADLEEEPSTPTDAE